MTKNEQIPSRHTAQEKSLTDLIGQLAEHSADVVRDEISLAKREMRENLERMQTGVIRLAIGSVIAVIALMSLCAALVIGLSYYMSLFTAALITGIGLLVIGGVIAYSGIYFFKKLRLELE